MPPQVQNGAVHVVGFISEGSGGFDWYFTTAAADEAFEGEKGYADEFADEDYTAYRFDYKPQSTDHEAITEEIDAQLDDLCDKAPKRYKKATGLQLIHTVPSKQKKRP